MLIMNRDDVTAMIKEDWGDSPQSHICNLVFQYLLSRKKAKHITYHRFKVLVGVNYLDEQILEAINYLCGSRVNLLSAKFEFIDGERVFPVEVGDVKEADSSGELVHPETGELVKNYKEKVSIYFEPTDLARRL